MSSNLYQQILEAQTRLKNVASYTPLEKNERLSQQYRANVFLKREDLQSIRSFKIRGAYNLMSSLTKDELKNGVACVSAGNHAQGVALSCKKLGVKGTIFMPENTPKQKIDRVNHFGGDWVEIIFSGKGLSEVFAVAEKFCKKSGAYFVHPFDDFRTIAGQGTIGLEILEQMQTQFQTKPDYILIAVGGGGLLAGIETAVLEKSPTTKFVSCECDNQASMYESVHHDKPTPFKNMQTFVDGTAVKQVGDKTFEIAKNSTYKFVMVTEGEICTEMINLYQNEGIVTEPSGALASTCLSEIADEIKGKNVVCVVCGGNNDLSRYPEIIEKSLVSKGLRHYFLIKFTQKPGELKNFVNQVLSPKDDIIRFEYIKKTNKEEGSALVGVEIADKNEINRFTQKLTEIGINFRKIETDDLIYSLLV